MISLNSDIVFDLVLFQPDFGMQITSPPRVSTRPVGLVDIEECRTSGVGENSNGKVNSFIVCSQMNHVVRNRS